MPKIRIRYIDPTDPLCGHEYVVQDTDEIEDAIARGVYLRVTDNEGEE